MCRPENFGSLEEETMIGHLTQGPQSEKAQIANRRTASPKEGVSDLMASGELAVTANELQTEAEAEVEFELGPHRGITDERPLAPRAHRKSKKGCRVCKERKIKCDETHPLCENCRIYFQGKKDRCDYGSSSSQTPQPTPPSRNANQRRKRKGKEKCHGAEAAQRASLPGVELAVQFGQGQDVRRESTTSSSSTMATPINPQMIDPFHTHPPTPELDADALLQHYFQTTVYTMFPFYPTSINNPHTTFYIPLIYTDPLLYHVTLQLSSLHLEKLNPSQQKLRSKRLMGECLKLLRERVEGVNEEGDVSDETIAGVAGLVGVEHERGNVRMVQMHMRGLKRMLHLRGGLNAIRRSNGMVANIVFCIFVAANEEPFPAIDLTSPWPKPLWYLDAAPNFVPPFYISFETAPDNVSHEFACCLQDIRVLAGTYQQASDCTDAEHYLSVLVYLCSTVQKVMSLPAVDDVRSEKYCVAEAVRASLIVHVFHQWCGRFQPDPSLLVGNARQNLKSALKPLMLPGKGSPLLLWFLAVGGVGSALGSAERKWFVGHAAAVAIELTISSYEELRVVLRRVAWHELQDDATHRVLWGEIEELME